MRILYSAIDQRVPSAHGGAVHVTAVAEGLAALGHEVHVLASPGDSAFPAGAVHWWPVRPPFGLRQLRLLRARRVLRLARRLRPDVIMERYYNFGGEGVLAARRLGTLAVLEVNAPAIDYPGSLKQRLDAWLLVRPLERWRTWQCRATDLIVTPTARILPPGIPRSRVLEAEWGADVVRFRPDAVGAVPFQRAAGETVVIFVGAFRAWHGAVQLVHAIRQLRARGRTDVKAVLVGDGPEFARVRAAADGVDGVILTGALPHEAIPACLAAADVGVAPFDVTGHPALAIDFYWSPLKIFEYMASGLPVVVPRIPRLADVVRDGREGFLYDAADPDGLAGAIQRAADSSQRACMGAAARERVAACFSWQRHCAVLDEAIRAAQANALTRSPRDRTPD
jgi:glycosyltransferase involved in cell wall biosynthesis